MAVVSSARNIRADEADAPFNKSIDLVESLFPVVKSQSLKEAGSLRSWGSCKGTRCWSLTLVALTRQRRRVTRDRRVRIKNDSRGSGPRSHNPEFGVD